MTQHTIIIPPGHVTVETWELRTLLRIATENRDQTMRGETWVQNLAHRCGLDLSDPEGANARRERKPA